MLNEEETLALIRLAKAGDQSAKETLLTHNTSLVKSILRRYLGKGVEYDDLYQLACMGFLKAITGFDETFGVRFSTYAVPMIAGEIKRFLRDDGSVKVSRVLKKTARDLNRYIETYAAEHGEQPTVKELAEAFGMDEGEVVFALGSARMPAKDDQDEMIEHMVLKEAIGKLPEREKKIVFLRYFRDMTQSEVARRIGVSQVQVSRIESKIMGKFKDELL